jgi:hypothetical protein
MTMSAPTPLRSDPAVFIHGGLKNRPGTLVLYPDRVVHVTSNAAPIGAVFGVIGMLLARRSAKKKAPARALAGGAGVTALPLTHLRSIRKGKHGLNKKILEITMSDGTVLKFAVKYDEWASEIARVARQLGRNAAPVNGGYDFA